MLRAPVFRTFAWPPWPFLFAVAGFGLVLSVQITGHATLPAFCDAKTPWLLVSSNGSDALELILALNPPARVSGDWALMLLAMMPPLLAAPVMHVWRSSLPSRRLLAVGLFALGYWAMWMIVGPILIGIALLVQLVAAEAGIISALLLALVWSASPWQRAALNRSHQLRRIGLFGWAAARDAVQFGTAHAIWCIASCWAWMLIPLVGAHWHSLVMILVGAVMLGERLATPDRARWRVPPLVRLLDLRPLCASLHAESRHA